MSTLTLYRVLAVNSDDEIFCAPVTETESGPSTDYTKIVAYLNGFVPDHGSERFIEGARFTVTE